MKIERTLLVNDLPVNQSPVFEISIKLAKFLYLGKYSLNVSLSIKTVYVLSVSSPIVFSFGIFLLTEYFVMGNFCFPISKRVSAFSERKISLMRFSSITFSKSSEKKILSFVVGLISKKSKFFFWA